MKPLEDNQLVWRIKTKRCDDSLLELISRHTRLFYKISQKYFPFTVRSDSQNVDDIIGSCNSIIYEAVLAFKPSKKVKFSTWLGNFVRYKCLNYLNKNSKLIDADQDQMDFFFQKKSLENYGNSKRVDDYLFVNNLISQFKDERMKKVFELRYFSGIKKMTWVNIGQKLELSAQTAINLHNRGKVMLKKKFTSELSIADRIL
jgi:RNA polymerase sigma factor (sigma-70 family)